MNIFLQQKSSYNRPADSSVGLFILPTTNCLQHFQTDLPTENSYRNCLQDFPTTSRVYVRSHLCIRVSFSRRRLGRLFDARAVVMVAPFFRASSRALRPSCARPSPVLILSRVLPWLRFACFVLRCFALSLRFRFACARFVVSVVSL